MDGLNEIKKISCVDWHPIKSYLRAWNVTFRYAYDQCCSQKSQKRFFRACATQ